MAHVVEAGSPVWTIEHIVIALDFHVVAIDVERHDWMMQEPDAFGRNSQAEDRLSVEKIRNLCIDLLVDHEEV